jgi:D-alanyl-D-alanine carboxypeptidase (penicillin-binding protein 5/6)
MKIKHYQLISLLLAAAMILGFLGSCAAQKPTEPGHVTLPPTLSSTPETTAPTVPVPTEPAQTQPTQPTEPSVPVPPPLEPLSPPDTAAQHAFIYDTRINQFLYSTDPVEKALYPASITKLFTSYVALLCLDPGETVTIGKERDLVALDASIAGLEKGTTWTVEGLLYGALLPSGCDASYSLAVAAGRKILEDPKAKVKDALAAFMAECNDIAEELGMDHTHFVTPDGYHDPKHTISIRGYMIIAKLVLENELLRTIAATPQITVTYQKKSGASATMTMHNTNRSLHPEIAEFYRPEAIGLKTGSTTPAGKCLLAAYQLEGGYLIIGVFGCMDTIGRFTSANTLFDYFMEQRGPALP